MDVDATPHSEGVVYTWMHSAQTHSGTLLLNDIIWDTAEITGQIQGLFMPYWDIGNYITTFGAGTKR